MACYRERAGAELTATPMLLIHGLGCSSAAFGPLMLRWDADAERRPALAPDMPGYGRSDAPRRALDIAALADWTLDFLDVMAVPRVHVVGHSMGCQVALALARRAPTRARSVTLIGPTTGDECQGLLRYGLGLAADAFAESLAWNWTLTRMALQMGVRRYVPTLRHLLRDRPIAGAAAVRCPVLALRGVHDFIIRRDAAQRLAAALPLGLYRELPVGAHALQYTHPALFWAACRPFVDAAERDE